MLIFIAILLGVIVLTIGGIVQASTNRRIERATRRETEVDRSDRRFLNDEAEQESLFDEDEDEGDEGDADDFEPPDVTPAPRKPN